MPAILASFTNGIRGHRAASSTDFNTLHGDINISGPLGSRSRNAEHYISDVSDYSDADEQCRPVSYASKDEALFGEDFADETKPIKRNATKAAKLARVGSPEIVDITAPLPWLRSQKQRPVQPPHQPLVNKMRSKSKTRSNNRLRAERPKINTAVMNEVDCMDALAIISAAPSSAVATPATDLMKSLTSDRERSPDTAIKTHTIEDILTRELATQTGHARDYDTRRTDVSDPVELAQSTSWYNSYQKQGVLHKPAANFDCIFESDTNVIILSPITEGFGQDITDGGDIMIIPDPLTRRSSEESQESFASSHSAAQSDASTNITRPSTSQSYRASDFHTKSLPPLPLGLQSTVQSRGHVNDHNYDYVPLQLGADVPADEAHMNALQFSPPSTLDRAFTRTCSPPLAATAFMRSQSRNGPGIGSTKIMRPSSGTGRQRAASCDPCRHQQRSPTPNQFTPIHPASSGRPIGCHSPPLRHASPVHLNVEAAITPSDHVSSHPLNLVRSTSPLHPSAFAAPAVPVQISKPRIAAAATTTITTTKRSRSQVPLASPDLIKKQMTSQNASNFESLDAAVAINVQNNSIGNIYNDIRNDCRFIAREVNNAAMFTSNSSQYNSSGRLRERARTATTRTGAGVSIGRLGTRRGKSSAQNDITGNDISAPGQFVAAPILDKEDSSKRETRSDKKKKQQSHASGQAKLVGDYDDLWS